MKRSMRVFWAGILGLLVLGGCSINRMAIKAVSNALTGEGSAAVFTSDSDPELVGEAIPFAIKMYETLLSSNPDHQGLILTTGSLFVMYANAFVQGPAFLLPPGEYLRRDAEYRRAKALYLRGAAILHRGLDLKYPGFSAAYRGAVQTGADEGGVLAALLGKTKKEDVPLLYWTVAGTLSAFSLNPVDLALGREIPSLSRLIARAYELDPDFNRGALDEFYLLFYGSLPLAMGGDPALAVEYFERAVEKTQGLSAGPYVAYAESIAIAAQDYPGFKANLEKALAIDPDADRDNRLVTILAQRKARFLLDNAPAHFIDLGEDAALYADDGYYDGYYIDDEEE
jgi:predicted anti-sigma-YlaC factor YlaD